MKRAAILAAAMLALFAAGCARTMANLYIQNESGAPVQQVQVTFPKATRGTQQLDQGAKIHHVVKITEDGELRLAWKDAAGREHLSFGPILKKDYGGDVRVKITGSEAEWDVTP